MIKKYHGSGDKGKIVSRFAEESKAMYNFVDQAAYDTLFPKELIQDIWKRWGTHVRGILEGPAPILGVLEMLVDHERDCQFLFALVKIRQDQLDDRLSVLEAKADPVEERLMEIKTQREFMEQLEQKNLVIDYEVLASKVQEGLVKTRNWGLFKPRMEEKKAKKELTKLGVRQGRPSGVNVSEETGYVSPTPEILEEAKESEARSSSKIRLRGIGKRATLEERTMDTEVTPVKERKGIGEKVERTNLDWAEEGITPPSTLKKSRLGNEPRPPPPNKHFIDPDDQQNELLFKLIFNKNLDNSMTEKTQKKMNDGADLVCRRCGKKGHVQKGCTSPWLCSSCKQSGHKKDKCPELCCQLDFGHKGHSARQCPDVDIACQWCGEKGHWAKECMVRMGFRPTNLTPLHALMQKLLDKPKDAKLLGKKKSK
jgi:hypothetical protein